MNYVSQLNSIFRERLANEDNLVVYGQNIAAGSCLSGLTRGFSEVPGANVLNTPNSENALVGLGFGLMLQGFNAAFFMKQQDFLLLGMDQLVNSWNILRQRGLKTSFTIVTIVVDSGFEGPQSRLNNLVDFCSMAHVRGLAMGNAEEGRHIINAEFVAPGFRILGLSQRLFGQEISLPDSDAEVLRNGDMFCYERGDDVTIVSANFAFVQAMEFWRTCREHNVSASLYSVPPALPESWDDVVSDVSRTKRLVVIDDSKSENRSTDRLFYEIAANIPGAKCVSTNRPFSEDGLRPNEDLLILDQARLLDDIGLGNIGTMAS